MWSDLRGRLCIFAGHEFLLNDEIPVTETGPKTRPKQFSQQVSLTSCQHLGVVLDRRPEISANQADGPDQVGRLEDIVNHFQQEISRTETALIAADTVIDAPVARRNLAPDFPVHKVVHVPDCMAFPTGGDGSNIIGKVPPKGVPGPSQPPRNSLHCKS